MYKDKRVEKKKTVTMKRNLNPIFNESFAFDIPTEKLRETTIIITVMDKDKLSRNDVIGKVGGKAGGVPHAWPAPRRSVLASSSRMVGERRAGQREGEGQPLPRSGPASHLKTRGLDGILRKCQAVGRPAADRPLEGQGKKDVGRRTWEEEVPQVPQRGCSGQDRQGAMSPRLPPVEGELCGAVPRAAVGLRKPSCTVHLICSWTAA